MATIDLGTIAFTPRGAYSGTTAYNKQDIVTYDNSTWVCVAKDTFNHRGAYDALFTYNTDDVVTDNGITYRAMSDGLVGVNPVGAAATDWIVITISAPGSNPARWELFTQGIPVSSSPTNGIWYYDGSQVVSLAPGDENQVLRINSSNQLEWGPDDARSGNRVANLLHGRSREVYRRTEVVMEDGSMRNWGANGNYQHGTGSYTASKSYAVNPGFAFGFPGVKIDPYQPTNRNKTTITLTVTQSTQSVQDLDANGDPDVDANGNPVMVTVPQYLITLPGGTAAAGNIDMTKGNIYKFDLSDASNTLAFAIQESDDGGTTWTTVTRQEIGNNFETSWYDNGGTVGTDFIGYLRIGEDEDRMYRYVSTVGNHGTNSNITGDVVGSTITLNTNGFVKFFRHNGMYAWTHYNNALGVIDDNGKVWMWGNNGNGVCGTGTTSHQYTPYPASDNTNNSINGKTAYKFAGEVGASSNNTCVWVVCDDGTIHHAGYSAHGQTGTGGAATNYFVQCINTTKIVDAHATNDSQDFVIMLEADGTLKHLGYGGTYGNGSNTNNSGVPTAITAVTQKVAEILYAGRRMVYVRDIDGNCWNWGNDNYGFLARNGTAGNYAPAIVVTNNDAGTNCVTEAVGNPDHDAYEHIITRRTDGKIYTAGYNGYGQLMNGNTTNSTGWVDISAHVRPYYSYNDWGTWPTNFIKLLNMGSGSYGWSGMLTEDGQCFFAGYNGNGQLGTGNTSHVNNGYVNRAFIPEKIIDIGATGYSSETGTMYLTEDGSLYMAGYNGDAMITGDDSERSDMPKMILF